MMIPTERIAVLRKHANRNLSYILDSLKVPFNDKGGGLFQGCCPCLQHGGDRDNPTAFSWREDIGRWVCWTHHCEDSKGNDIFGLVSSIKGTNFKNTVQWITDILTQRDVDLEHVPADAPTVARNDTPFVHEPLAEDNIKFLHPDPQYLLNRGFDLEILRQYQVGMWSRPGTFMHDRVVFPIRDHDGYLVGYTGRTVHNKDYFEKRGLVYAKWVHSRSYTAWPKRGERELFISSLLFNLFKAKTYIQDSKRMILVEGPLDGMKLEEANIHNWVGTLGTKFSPAHRTLLIKHGVRDLFVAYDNDPPKGPHQRKAGDDGWNRIQEIVGDLLNIYRVPLPEGKDCGALSVSLLKDIFKDIRC